LRQHELRGDETALRCGRSQQGFGLLRAGTGQFAAQVHHGQVVAGRRHTLEATGPQKACLAWARR
jgi:hypothetical protein